MVRSHGFSLLELLLVTSILGVVAAVAIPAIAAWLPDYRLRRAAGELYGCMQQMKLEAVRRNAVCGILFDAGNGCYYLCSGSGPDGLWTSIADNSVEKRVDLQPYGSGVAFGHGCATQEADADGGGFDNGSVTYNQGVILFGPTGMSDSGYVYLEHQEQDRSYAVGTLATGLIMMRQWDGVAWR